MAGEIVLDLSRTDLNVEKADKPGDEVVEPLRSEWLPATEGSEARSVRRGRRDGVEHEGRSRREERLSISGLHRPSRVAVVVVSSSSNSGLGSTG